MKYIKSYIFLTLMVVSLVGCKVDDLKDDVNDLKDRVTLMEEQVKLLNDNVEVLSYVLDPQQKTINGVKPSDDNTQFTITLSDGSTMTLTVGKPGKVEQPTISVDENGYWVVNGIFTGVKAEGKEGSTPEIPEFRVHDGAWQFRFGEDGEWKPVEGGNIGGGSLGDQIFESAKVDGDKFVITLANDGGTYELPIVSQLSCEINKDMVGADGYIEFQPGETKNFKVKITGTPLAPVYPSGWRAELEKLDSADENGYNYQLVVYAPEQTSASSLANVVASNISEISVRVNKDVFWAVDKINVKLPKVYDSNYARFLDGATLSINGYEFSKESLDIDDDQKIHIVTGNTEISGSGVYFVKEDNITFTYNLENTNSVDYLVIVPYDDTNRRSKLTVQKQVYLNKFFICQNVDIEYTASSSYVLCLQPGTPVDVIMNNCNVSGLVAGSGFAMPQIEGEVSLEKFSAVSCNFNIDKDISTKTLYVITGMNCGTLEFVNNIVYRSFTLSSSSLNMKIYNGKTKENEFEIASLIFNNNTIVGLESNTTAMVYAKLIGAIDINNNIFWNTEMGANSMFIRYMNNMQDPSKATGGNNIGYSGTNKKTFKVFFTDSGSNIVCPPTFSNSIADFQKSDIFNVDDANSFNTTTGVFIPTAAYSSYGAQR
ncbi:PL29 family lyase N-terminal domain-containing protein [Phocaeicola plebeius]|uniref:PL29 family lyase N-terminal domain-containing protein n=1 Tax=Phocaeicola plebeius TaxID=310297 RepID=UPI0026ECD745|nr:PL29 family lyase N-terminal domain-containing protein [Phocaeicola plebeius]